MFCRIVFNVSNRFIFPLLVSGVDADCIEFTACSSTKCSNPEMNKVKAIFFKKLVFFCKKLSIDVFKRYKTNKDYFSDNLDIERNV